MGQELESRVVMSDAEADFATLTDIRQCMGSFSLVIDAILREGEG